jgi:hypothetical protein
VIPDDVERLKLALPFDYRDDLGRRVDRRPDWFFRVSKYSIAFLRHPWVPRTVFLHEVARCRQSRGVDSEAALLLRRRRHYLRTHDADVAAIPARKAALIRVTGNAWLLRRSSKRRTAPREAEVRLMLVREGDGTAWPCRWSEWDGTHDGRGPQQGSQVCRRSAALMA